MLRQSGARPVGPDTEAGLLSVGLYGVAAALVIYPSLDLIASVVPVDTGSVQWRFGAIAFFAQTFWSVLLALGLAAAVAWVREHGAVLRLVAVCAVIVMLTALVVTALGALDFLQARQMVRQAAKVKVDVAGGRLVAQSVLAVLVGAPLALGCWRAADALKLGTAKKGADQLGKVYSVGSKQPPRG